MSHYVQRVKVGVIGPPKSGKTHFLHAFLFPQPTDRTIAPTVAIEFYERIIVLTDREVALRVWDTSGQEKYRPMVPTTSKNAMRQSQCTTSPTPKVLIYQLSLNRLQTLIAHLQKEGLDLRSKKLIAIGNKLDIIRTDSQQRQVRYQQIKQLLLALSLPTDDIYEVNSKDPSPDDRQYIKEIFEEILTEILEERLEDQLEGLKVKLGEKGITVTQGDEKEQGYCGECSIY